MEVEGEHSVACFDLFANYFAGKIDHIHSELDARSLDVQEHPSSPILWDCFKIMQPQDVGTILGGLRLTTCQLDPCPSWLITGAKAGLGDWLVPIINCSLTSGLIPKVL